MNNITEILNHLVKFTGTMNYYQCDQYPYLYWTDGVQFYCSQLNNMIILEHINYYSKYIGEGNLEFLKTVEPNIDTEQLYLLKGVQFWHVTLINSSPHLCCRADTDYPSLFQIPISLTYNVAQKFYCQRHSTKKWVLMLNSEY